jgi:SpoVK/Ycf46/Vps4 family AAA+-type ATPase
MARSDLLTALAVAALESDLENAQHVIAAIATEEADIGHVRVAARLRALLNASELAPKTANVSKAGQHSTRDLGGQRGFQIRPTSRKLSDVQLSAANRHVLSELVAEQVHAKTLRDVGLEPRHRLLLTGAPGTGKTSLSEALAAELHVPMLVAQYEDIIGSYLGETSSRLHAVFSEAAASPSVLFLDEFDTLAKERGDQHDTGEVKRVVSTLLLQIDALPSHVVVIAATNHPELLDRAAWRRFQLRIEMPLPGADERVKFAAEIVERVGLVNSTKVIDIARLGDSFSFADVEEIVLGERRREVLASLLPPSS